MRFTTATVLAGLAVAAASPATARQAVVDGVTYAVPDDVAFMAPPPHAGVVPGERLQAAVDRNRAEGPSRQAAEVLFSTVGLPGRQTFVVLQEQPASHPSNARILEGVKRATYEDGVAVFPGDRLFAGGEGKLAYAVRTGLPFAPLAYALCGKVEGGATDCAFQATLAGRLRLVVQHADLRTDATDALRASLVIALRGILPAGMPSP